MLNISDLDRVNELKTQRDQYLAIKQKVNDGEQIVLTIGGNEVPITKPEIEENARYQLNVHFDEQLSLIKDELQELGVSVDG